MSLLMVPACPDLRWPIPFWHTAAVYTAVAWTENAQKGTNTKLVDELSSKLDGASRFRLWKAKNSCSASC